MTIRKLLQITLCVLAIPGGASFGGCTEQQVNQAIVAFGSAAALVVLAALLSHAFDTRGGSRAPGGGAVAVEAGSDARLKTDIAPVALLPNGLTLYSFKYRADPTTTYVGVIAQDLLNSGNEMYRHAVVVRPDGHYAVDYRALGLRMVTLDQWNEVQAEACRHPETQCRYIRMSDLNVGRSVRLGPVN